MGEQRVEVGLEVGKGAQRRERVGYALMPPSAFEAAEFVVMQAAAEGQARRGTERTAKTGGDGIFGGVEAEVPREAGVGASDGLARLEQSSGGVEESSGDHQKEMRAYFFAGGETAGACGSSAGGLRRAHQKMSQSVPHA